MLPKTLPGLSAELYQIGVVVADIDQGMRDYSELLGIGPFWRLDTDYTARYRGWTGRAANRNAFARWDSLYLEMIAPGQGDTNAREWLRMRGPGIFHLGFATDDITQRPMGAEVVFESLDSQGRPAVVHLDTVAQLGYYVELAPRAMVEKLCARIDAEVG